jgi:hypothetical protein
MGKTILPSEPAVHTVKKRVIVDLAVGLVLSMSGMLDPWGSESARTAK